MDCVEKVNVWLVVTILHSSNYEIEAATLDAIAQEAGQQSLEQALAKASVSERRGGAFGLEMLGTALIPVLLAAVAQFWATYQKSVIDSLARKAADATIAHTKKWFSEAATNDTLAVSDGLAAAIRTVGKDRGLAQADIDALVAGVAPQRLLSALAAG